MKDFFGKPIKKLGFGFMRLPALDNEPNNRINVEEVKEMVDLYMKHGFTYFDTAFVYNNGKSEEAFRAAVTERYARQDFQAASKLPLWKPADFDQMRQMTQTSLDRMGLDYLDLYLLHGIGPERLEMIDKSRAWEYLAGLKKSGKAINVGFSYHGDAGTLDRILDDHAEETDIVQLQVNYLDWEDENVQARKCYESAVTHGVGIIIMEPIKGGSLANFTPAVADIFKKADPDASLASWALRFTLGLDGVVSVLSGMSTLEQARDNIAVAEQAKPLSDADMKVIAAGMEELKKIPTIPCTACNYCVDDCPEKINTPKIMGVMNDYLKYQNLQGARRFYDLLTNSGPSGFTTSAKSSQCTECGSCEEHCPQKINIMETHKKAVELFE